MPGQTPSSNPWAEELKKSRRKSSHTSIKGIQGNEAKVSGPHKGQSETTANVIKEKAIATQEVENDKCVKANNSNIIEGQRSPPPKVRPPSLPEDSRSLYQDARSQLRPVARMLSRSLSKEAKNVASSDDEATETPVDRLIRQGSIEPVKPEKVEGKEKLLKEKSSSSKGKTTNASARPSADNSKKMKKGKKEEDWGDEGEWEWESEEEEEEKQPAPKTLPDPPKPSVMNNGTSLTNGTAMKNGNHTNGTHAISNGNHLNNHINNEDKLVEEASGKADIKIQGNLLKIARTAPVDWSDEEYEEEDEPEKIEPPPPPPPPPAPAPPPPPPPPAIDEARARKLSKIEALKKRPLKRPDWNELMREIDGFRYGHSQKLKKTVCNDRSKPMLTKIKIKGKFIYDSEKNLAENDIFHEIKKGVKLRHVKTNDRSKPNLMGIRAFRRQLTKEEKLKMGSTFDEPLIEDDEDEDMDKLRDDLESTKQLLDLEIRSKKLLEKDNKRMAQELERLKQEFAKMSGAESTGGFPEGSEDASKARRNSVALKRHSVIRLLSESESNETQQEVQQILEDHHCLQRNDQEEEEASQPQLVAKKTIKVSVKEEEEPPPSPPPHVHSTPAAIKQQSENFYEEEIAEIEEMREEVDEARKLAEEWESKYKEMQRQMSELESSRYKKHSIVLDNVPLIVQKKASVTSEYEAEDGEDGDYTWMLKREIHGLNNKLRHVQDKREIVVRERQLLQERIECLVESIGNEVESRKRLRKEINEMNEAFKEEIREMAAEQKAAEELEECYFSDEDELVPNTHKRDSNEDDEWETKESDDEEVVETVEDVIKQAEEDEEDPGAELFDNYPQSDNEEVDESELTEEEYESTRECLNKRVERHAERVQSMRKSNFMLKAKIDRLYDLLQMQKEKHHDLRQELTRMLADIQ